MMRPQSLARLLGACPNLQRLDSHDYGLDVAVVEALIRHCPRVQVSWFALIDPRDWLAWGLRVLNPLQPACPLGFDWFRRLLCPCVLQRLRTRCLVGAMTRLESAQALTLLRNQLPLCRVEAFTLYCC
jgi:hypothetical protein